MKTSLLILALFLSSLSLGLQLKKDRSAPLFEKYLTTARISDAEYRSVLANEKIIQDAWILKNGVGLPQVAGLSEDDQQVICRVDISEEDLPKAHDQQKKVLEQTAWMVVGDVASAFDLHKFGQRAMFHAVRVEFRSIEATAKKGPEAESYAEFSEGQLTFH